jgi:hypothetical protein
VEPEARGALRGLAYIGSPPGGGSKAMDVGSCDIDVAEYVTVGVTVCAPPTRLDAGTRNMRAR